MELNELKLYSVDELYEKLLPISNNICEQYKSTIITDTVYKKLILKAIKESIEKINEKSAKNFDTYFTNKLKDIFITYILIVIKDNSKINIIINDYINRNIKDTSENITAIKQINQLLKFFEDINYYPKFDECEELTKNTNISNNLEVIVNSNLTSIMHNQTNKIFDSEILISIIEIYCMNNNIEIDYNLNDYDIRHKTNNDIDIVNAYFNDISKYPLLSANEEKELGYKILEGDELAREKLILSNLRLAASIANQFRGRGLDFSDLIQEASKGLMKAVDKYDVTLGHRFSTYATYWIRQSVNRGISNNSKIIKISIQAQEKIATVNMVRQKLISELKREPSDDEVSEITGYEVDEIKFLDDINREVLSLNAPLTSAEGCEDEFIDFIKDDNSMEDIAENNILHDDLLKLMDDCKLSPRQKQVLILHYMEGQDFAKIGRQLNYSRELIRQTHNKAIKKLLKFNKTKQFASYLDNPEEAIEKVGTKTKSKDYDYKKYVYSKKK